jgi:hypothetical protein
LLISLYIVAQSSKAEYEMLAKGINELDKDVALLRDKKLTFETDHKSMTAKLEAAKAKLADTVRREQSNEDEYIERERRENEKERRE